jgi:membrane protease YdiL (CAAX protease family)
MRNHTRLFFALAYGWSWLFWIPAALSARAFDEPPVPLLIALGGIGPLVAAIALIYTTQDRSGRRDYWQRVVDLRRIRAGWYAVTILTVPALTALAVLLDILAGGTGAHLEARFRSGPLGILPFAVFTLFFGPLPEEVGWRGYALGRLQRRHTALAASLILGIGWTFWHLPLFFVRGSYQNGLGWGSAGFWWYMTDKTFASVLMTWIYNNTRRSTLSAVLFHFLINFVGELVVLTERADFFQIFVWAGAALVVVAIWGRESLARAPEGGPGGRDGKET